MFLCLFNGIEILVRFFAVLIVYISNAHILLMQRWMKKSWNHFFCFLLINIVVLNYAVYVSWIARTSHPDFILTRIREHQLECVCFDFIEKELPDLRTGDEIITIADLAYTINIHHFAKENHVALGLKWKQKRFF